MKKKIFLKFFSVTLVSVLLMFAFGIVAVSVNAKNTVKERLAEETGLAALLLRGQEGMELLDGYSGNHEFRITVFDLSGNVLYESDTGAELDNHADREEIQSALLGSPAPVERYSETFQCKMTYYAVKTALGDGSEVILRLAVRSSRITSYVTVAIPLLIAVLAASLIISFVLSGLLSGSVSSKFTDIGKSLRALNEGSYAPIRTDMSEPELFAVFNEINELGANLHSHIRTAEQERIKLNTVLDNVSQGIIALNGEKEIIFANKSALALFGGSLKNVGRDLIFLVEDLELYEKITAHLTEDQKFDYSLDGKELSVITSRVTDAAISADISAIVIVTDVTAERLIGKQKSDFFANASHELKTPITVLQGLSEVLLAKDGLDEGSRKQLERIHKESVRLASLISDMLKLSRLESGDGPEEVRVNVALEAVAGEVIAELSEEIAGKGLEVHVTGSGSVHADPKMMYELVENLISNAVKYNKEGGKVDVSISEMSERVCLRVKDSGIGIEKEHLPRLCERFYRVDKSHSKKTGGTGLGLAIVKHICAIYKAELSIESNFGIGTTVSIVF